MKKLTLSIITALAIPALSYAHWDGGRPDGHAPIGVMGEHMHKAGEWMASYRYMYMDMDGIRHGEKRVSTKDVHQSYPVAPEKMSMEMHMLGMMYAPSDNITLMAMLPWVKNDMDMLMKMGGGMSMDDGMDMNDGMSMNDGMTSQFSTSTDGLGDIKIGALIHGFTSEGHRLLWNINWSLPTASTDETVDTPMMNGMKAPYAMQLGSGTHDIDLGYTYIGQSDNGSWGQQTIATVRFGRNDEDYRLGNKLLIQGWYARKLSDSWSLSGRVAWNEWGGVVNQDDDLNPMMSPAADADFRSGTRVDVGLGANLYIRSGALKGHRLALEYLVPVKQDLDGIQMETDATLIAGWQLAF
jgi:hypothetical protein